MLLRGMDSHEKLEKTFLWRVNWNIIKLLQDVSCTKFHLSWKFHENAFIRFLHNIANRHTDRQTDKPMDNDENKTFASAEVIKLLLELQTIRYYDLRIVHNP